MNSGAVKCYELHETRRRGGQPGSQRHHYAAISLAMTRICNFLLLVSNVRDINHDRLEHELLWNANAATETDTCVHVLLCPGCIDVC